MSKVIYEIDYSFNPAILRDRDEIHFQSNLIPNIGDILAFRGFKMTIVKVDYSQGYPVRPVHVQVEADSKTMTMVRELLTFGIKDD